MKRVFLVSVIILLSFSLSAHNPYAAAGYPVRPYLPEPVHHRDPHHDYNGEVTVLAAALDVPERNADAILSLLHHVRMSSERRGRAWDEMRAVIRTLEEIYTMRDPRGAEDRALREFSQVMELNIHALHRLTREVGRRWMIPGRYGRILNLSSVKSMIGTTENYAAYCASKGAVNMYTRQLACEWGKYGITCNAIAPTFVRTPINSFQLDDAAFYKKLTERIPLGRIGSKQDIAAAAVFLCSDAAAFISGQILCVDGGLTAMQ